MNTKIRVLIYPLVLIGFILFLSTSCKKVDDPISLPTLTAPVISTTAATEISDSSVNTGGNLSSAGGASILSCGVCWGINKAPTIADNRTNNGTKVGIFTCTITSLKKSTTYYLRAYAINSVGTTYGNQIVFQTYSGSVMDIDSNVYHTVTIGTKVCMAENLTVTKFSNGDSIPVVNDSAQWSNQTTAASCNYSDNQAFSKDYGMLYNWYVVADSRNICPNGWHVPSDAEWTNLTNSLGGESVAGGKLKETGTAHWRSPNKGATNENNFTALPGGYRFVNGSFFYLRSNGYWWTSTELGKYDAYGRSMFYYLITTTRIYVNKSNGFSIRCFKD